MARMRRAAATALSTQVAGVLLLLCNILTVPLFIERLGHTGYGLTATALSFLSLFSMADIGVGRALMVFVAGATGKKDRARITRMCSSAAAASMVNGLLVLCAGAGLVWMVDAGALFNAPGALASDVDRMLLWVALGAGGALAINPMRAAFRGYQEGYYDVIIDTAIRLLELGVRVYCVVEGLGLVAFIAWPVLLRLVLSALSVPLVWVRHPETRPRPSAVRFGDVVLVVKNGASFMVMQVSAVLYRNSTPALLTTLVAPAAVTPYDVAFKMFFYGNMFVHTVASAMAPAYGEAVARGDWPWVQRAFDRSLRAGMGASGLVLVCGALFGGEVITLWAGADAVPPMATLLALGVFFGPLSSWVVLLANYLIGVNRHWHVSLSGVSGAALGLGFGAGFIFWAGPAGAMWGAVLGMALTDLWYIPRAVRKVSGGRLRAPWWIAARLLLLCSVPAVVVGLVARSLFSDPWALVLVGGGASASAYAAALWMFGLSAAERAGLVRRLRRGAGDSA